MPLGAGVRYRVKDGVRLAFKGDKVVEAKKVGRKKGRKRHTRKVAEIRSEAAGNGFGSA